MLHITKEDERKFKEILSVAFEDTNRLKAEFDRASKARRAHPGDHQSAVLGTYVNMLRDILEERTKPYTPPPGTVSMPPIEQLKRKYFGNDKK